MSVTANGNDVLAMRLTLPLDGIWVATLQISADEDMAGALRLENDGVVFTGTILRGFTGQTMVDAVGGSGGLGRDVDARSYRGASARDIIADLLAAVGERLDGSSSRDVLATSLPFWTRARGRASLALSTLTDALGARWRVLPSGNIWVGTETWPAVASDYEALELDRDSAAGTVLLAAETIALGPGVVLQGERVGRVEHVMHGEALRTTFWLEAPA